MRRRRCGGSEQKPSARPGSWCSRRRRPMRASSPTRCAAGGRRRDAADQRRPDRRGRSGRAEFDLPVAIGTGSASTAEPMAGAPAAGRSA